MHCEPAVPKTYSTFHGACELKRTKITSKPNRLLFRSVVVWGYRAVLFASWFDNVMGLERMTKGDFMEFESYKSDFARDGFVIVRDFLSLQEVAELERNLSRYIGEIVPGLPPTDAFYETKGSPETLKQMQFMHNNDAFFDEFLRRNTYLELAEALLGMPAIAQGVEYFNKPAGIGKQTPPHQDGYYFTLVPSEALTLWFALDEVDEENGCVRYVPGSHKKGMRLHNLSNVLGFSQGIADWSPQDQAHEVKTVVRPGDLLAHHCDTIHRADANFSQRSRRAVAIVYYAAQAIPDLQAKARYMESSMKQREILQAN